MVSRCAYPSYCSACTFNIAAGKTLTIDASYISCANCSFSGGNIAIAKDFACQTCSFTSDSITMASTALNLQSSATSFTGVTLTATGTGSITANAAVNLTSSVFRFNGTGFFLNNGGTLNMTKSQMYFYDNSYFLANAGPVNLKTTSSLVAGNGSSSSTAYIQMNGPQLNIYDNSFINLTAKNNVYLNWGTYYSASNNKTYATATNTVNCGSTYQNKCSASKVYGPATLNAAGIVTGNVLPVVLTDFNALLNGNAISISWETQIEVNAGHFTIERSADGSNWEAIGTVNAKGNSSVAGYYSFTDASPLSGSNYYRMQMVDLDGNEAASKVIHIATSVTEGKIGIFPNPIINATFNLKVSTTEQVIVNVFTTEGRLLSAFSLRGEYQYQLQLPSAAPRNAYIAVKVISNGNAQTMMVLNK